MSQTILLHNYIAPTAVEGPGIRIAIWMQGCHLKCVGCFNPETWDEGGEQTSVNELFNRIKKDAEEYPNIEGVTFLGGEPFQQAKPLAELAKLVRGIGLSILTFSGYTYEHLLTDKEDGWSDLLAVTDLLIDGPFVKNLEDLSRPWVGSANQKYRFLTDRYKYLKDSLFSIKNKLEVHLKKDGTVFINGISTSTEIEQLKQVFFKE